jgi:hypothetical protein
MSKRLGLWAAVTRQAGSTGHATDCKRVAYRGELVGQQRRLVHLGSASLLGGLLGAVLLLALPGGVFKAAVPVLIALASVLMAFQPRLSARLQRRGDRPAVGGRALLLGVFLTGVYGGYFGAAQGVILIALLAILIDDELQRLNGLKNVIASVINAVAAIIFVIVAPVAWGPAILLAIGSTIGGQLGAVLGRRLSPIALRVAIITIGTIVAVKLLLG